MNIDKLLEPMTSAPDGQLDPDVCADIKNLIGLPVTEQLLGLIDIRDHCIMGGLASSFVMKVFDGLIDVAGKKHNELDNSLEALNNAKTKRNK